MKRHPDLTLRKREPTSIDFMSVISRHNFEEFLSNVRCVLHELKLEPHQLCTVELQWDRGHNGSSTRVSYCWSSRSRRNRLTWNTCNNERLWHINTTFLFSLMLTSRMFSCATAFVAHQSGWIVQSTFIEWFKHFLKHVKTSTDQLVMLLLDNLETHLSLIWSKRMVWQLLLSHHNIRQVAANRCQCLWALQVLMQSSMLPVTVADSNCCIHASN